MSGIMNAELPIALVEPRDFTAALGGLVRALRQRANWTQPELASRSGVPVSTLSRLERTGLASTDRLARILFALDALDAFQDFLVARRRLADLPTDLRSFRPDAPKPVRIRHRHASKGDSA
jgi:transcriptional regulator with XRE-family HTH domain